MESRANARLLVAPQKVTFGDVVLSATIPSVAVAPGDVISIETRVDNAGGRPASILSPRCGGVVSGIASLQLPLEPPGRAWPGVAQTFKEYVLKEGLGPGAVPATAPIELELLQEPCTGGSAETELEPGQSVAATLTARAELISDLPALDGQVPITLTVALGSDEGSEPVPGASRRVPGGRSVLHTPLTLTSEVEIRDEGVRLASMGQVIDGVLADPTFMKWLEAREPGTWANANMFLIHAEESRGVVPAGTWWELDLFREVGVPRDSAIAFIDPHDASVRSVSYCTAYCD